MANRVRSNGNNFIRWQKILGSLTLSELQAEGLPPFVNQTTNSFVTQWTTTLAGASASNQIDLPLVSGGTYDFIVDWGDGLIDNITSHADAARLHTYAATGTYEVSITGTLIGWNFDSSFGLNDNVKLILISNWGIVKPTDLPSMFDGCTNLEISAIDAPDLSLVTNMFLWFRFCSSLTGAAASFNTWDVSGVTNMGGLFLGASVFNADLSSWNVSSVTTMASMFNLATLFNADLSSWNVSSVTIMSSMFGSCAAFNQNINSWNVAAVTTMSSMFQGATSFDQELNSWNVAAVTTMASMFSGATAFNRELNSWNVAAVTTMSSMFQGATAFNEEVFDWNVGAVTTMASMFSGATAFNGGQLTNWNITSVTNMTNMFLGVTMTTFNYDTLLINWEAQAVQNNVTFNGGSSTYSAGAAATARAALIADHTWTITDGGPA